MAGRFFLTFKPIAKFLPEVVPPKRRVDLGRKLIWTGLVLIIYLIMSQVPLYGVATLEGGDPFAPIRVIVGGSRGSILELGIGPIVTGGLILQLLAGSGIISYDPSNPEDRALFTTASKFLSLLIALFSAIAYVVGGQYGHLPLFSGLIVILQLFIATLILMLMDELLQKGWGLGSGVSLFILAGVAKAIWWSALNPFPVEGGQAHGAIIAYFQAILAGEDPITSFYIRPSPYQPTMLGLVVTITMIIFVIYLQGIQVNIPIVSSQFRGYGGIYPVKLLYVSNIPVILASTLFTDLYLVGNIVQSNPALSGTLLADFIGRFNSTTGTPISGLVYYITPPRGVTNVLLDPLRALIYMAILISICIIFSATWLTISGMDPDSVARQLVDSGVMIPGFRRAVSPVSTVLSRYIPAVTILGGLLVGLISVLGDFLGVYGSGTGILLSVGIVYQYYELLQREQAMELYPELSRLLGEK